ncbi:MAG: hypothetical protein GC150_12930 [Rhizobiales bacterium]|nr:hypothetical protein [Hyphomicrobiales bacterium]
MYDSDAPTDNVVDLMRCALGHQTFPAFIVNWDGSIIASNLTGAERLGEVLAPRATVPPGRSARLDDCVRALVERHRDCGRAEGRSIEPVDLGEDDLAFLVARRLILEAEGGAVPEADGYHIVTLRTGGWLRQLPSDELIACLRTAFKFTLEEAKTALALAMGETINSIAASSGRQGATVRGHVNSCLRKTNTKNQKDLVACVLVICQ